MGGTSPRSDAALAISQEFVLYGYGYRVDADDKVGAGALNHTAMDARARVDAPPDSAAAALGAGGAALFVQLAAGLAEVADTGAVDDAATRLALAQEVRMLTLPGEMGERFQALAFLRDFDASRLPWLGADEGWRL